MKNNICKNCGKLFAKSCASCSKRGKHYSPQTEFKKGLIPWNISNSWS